MEYISEFILKSKQPIFQDVEKVIKIESKSACGENENFLGQVLRVKCFLKMKSGEEKEVSMIVKKAPGENLPFTKMYYESKVFDYEIEMYEKVLSNMEKLIAEEPGWNLWPAYYGHNNSDIFLQDLSDLGYESYSKFKPLDVTEASVVFKSLGIFHGTSLYLISRGLYDPSNMLQNQFVRKVSAIDAISEETCNNFADAIEAEWGPEWQSYPERIRKLSKEMNDRAYNLWFETRGKFDVINHGDCWINNMLFKYHQDGDLQSMKFVDFQTCHYNSFSWDLMQVLYSAVLPKFRNKYLDDLLNNYHCSLHETANKLGYSGLLPTLQQVREELDKLDLVALTRSIVTYTYFYNTDLDVHETTKESFDNNSLFRASIVKEILQDTLIYFNKRNIF